MPINRSCARLFHFSTIDQTLTAIIFSTFFFFFGLFTFYIYLLPYTLQMYPVFAYLYPHWGILDWPTYSWVKEKQGCYEISQFPIPDSVQAHSFQKTIELTKSIILFAPSVICECIQASSYCRSPTGSACFLFIVVAVFACVYFFMQCAKEQQQEQEQEKQQRNTTRCWWVLFGSSRWVLGRLPVLVSCLLCSYLFLIKINIAITYKIIEKQFNIITRIAHREQRQRLTVTVCRQVNLVGCHSLRHRHRLHLS